MEKTREKNQIVKDNLLIRNKITEEVIREKNEVTTREKILNKIRENPKITIKQLSELTGISVKGIEWQIKKLKQQGKLKRIGPDKGGFWKIVE